MKLSREEHFNKRICMLCSFAWCCGAMAVATVGVFYFSWPPLGAYPIALLVASFWGCKKGVDF